MKNSYRLLLFVVAVFCAGVLEAPGVFAQENAGVVVFYEADFPAADAAAPSRGQLEKVAPGAHFASLAELAARLNASETQLLVLPFGSAFPEAGWPSIEAFLRRGGNLLALGGRPFSRPAYHDASGWHLRDYQVRFMRALMIDQYQTTPGSEGLEFQTNPEVTLQPKAFAWKQAFSPVIRLSAVDLYNRGGSTGSIDAKLDTLAWGVKGGRKMAAPLLQIDHYRNGFDGGRWIFLAAEVAADFYEAPQNGGLIEALAQRALSASEEFTARPTLPLYLPGEPVQVELKWTTPPVVGKVVPIPDVILKTFAEGHESKAATVRASLDDGEAILPAPAEKGFHIVEARLVYLNETLAIYRSGFWVSDEEFLRGGPRLSVNQDYFEMDSKPLAVAGTTYMSSEVQRLYFEHPNAYVWNEDLKQIHDAKLNMIRAGWWTGWDKLCDENGQPYERTLRTIEAYLMTAHKYGCQCSSTFSRFCRTFWAG